MNKNNYNAVDLCKFMLMVYVVVRHAGLLAGFNSAVLDSFISTIDNFVPPFFFVTTGFFLSKKSKDDSLFDADVLKKNLKKTIYMYLFWTAIYLPTTVVYFYFSGASFIGSIYSFFRGLIFTGEHQYTWHLWYVHSAAFALIILYLLTKHKAKNKMIVCLAILALTIKVAINCIVEVKGGDSTVLKAIYGVVKATISNGRVFTGLFFITFGALLNRIKYRNTLLYLAIFVTAFAISVIVPNEAVRSLLAAITTTSLFMTMLCLNIKDTTIFKYLRNMCTYLYFIHLFVLVVVTKLIYGEVTRGPIPFVITMVITLLISFIISQIKTKKSKKTI